MGVESVYTYPAPLERVFPLFSDAAVLAARYEAVGATDVEILECEDDGTSLRVVSRRTVESAVPDFAARFIQPRNTITQTEEWGALDGPGRSGTWSVEVRGIPVAMAGEISLRNTPGGTEYRVSGRVSVGIPLVGRKLAAFVEEDLRAKLDAEHRHGLAWLAGR